MTTRKTTHHKRRIPSGLEPATPVPELPAWKAFVVQFTREADVPAGIFSGRVEHLNSGRRARFASSAELVTLLERFLAEIGTDPPKCTEARS